MVMCKEPVMRAAAQRLLRRELVPDRHEAGHFRLGDFDFLAAPIRQGQILHQVVVRDFDCCVHC